MDCKTQDPSPDISVIVPVYNAGEHLRACLDSATGQTHKNIEIICVNDCSSDDSLQILQGYAAADTRVQVLTHKQNKGEGASRNTGVEHAKGGYIFHLDADDTIPLNALECLYSHAETHGSEMVKGAITQMVNNNATDDLNWMGPNKKIVNTNIYESPFLQSVPPSHCSYLYKRAFLNEYHIHYMTDLTIGLDLIMLAMALTHARKVTLIPDLVYRYRQTEDSATRGQLAVKTLLESVNTKREVFEILRAANLTDAANDYLQAWSWQISRYWINMAHNQTLETCSAVFSDFRALLSDRVLPWRENTRPQYRYLLALLMANQDKKAVEFLRSEEILCGFSQLDTLGAHLAYIVSHYPDDIGALYRLGTIAIEQKQYQSALTRFEHIIGIDKTHYNGHLKRSAALRHLGRLDEAYHSLCAAQKILETGAAELAGDITHLLRERDHLARDDKQIISRQLQEKSGQLRTTTTQLERRSTQLEDTRRELESIYASRSWRITQALRKLRGLFSRPS